MCPVVVLHGGRGEEGVVARGPATLEGLFSRVQFHVVVEGPLLREASVTQVAREFPAGERKRCQEGAPRPGPAAGSHPGGGGGTGPGAERAGRSVTSV